MQSNSITALVEKEVEFKITENFANDWYINKIEHYYINFDVNLGVKGNMNTFVISRKNEFKTFQFLMFYEVLLTIRCKQILTNAIMNYDILET